MTKNKKYLKLAINGASDSFLFGGILYNSSGIYSANGEGLFDNW